MGLRIAVQEEQVMNKRSRLLSYSTLLGNVLDNYDITLYALLVPILSPLFFKQSDPIVGLILGYGIGVVGILSRPLGAWLFGSMVLNYGARRTLTVILWGMMATTVALGVMPAYSVIGVITAPLLLVFIRMLQGFFSAGETTVAPLFFLEQQPSQHLGKASGYFEISTMIGVGLASLAGFCVYSSSHPEYYWRCAFFASVLTALPVLGLRLASADTPVQVNNTPVKRLPCLLNLQFFLTYKYELLGIMIVNSFNWMIYTVVFIFLNAFVPLITHITEAKMLADNSALTLLDTVLLLCFAHVVDKFPHPKWMAVMSATLACSIVPLFYYLPSFSAWGVLLMRVGLVMIGVGLVIPLNAWVFNLVDGRAKYVVSGMGRMLGAEIFGRTTATICFGLFYCFHTTLAPALYIMIVSLATTAVLLGFSRVKTSRVLANIGA